MKTEIVLCDKCKDRIAKKVCVICEKDVCESCYEEVPIRFGWNESEFTKLIICKVCKSQIIDLLKEKQHDSKKFNELIIDYLRDNLALEELGKEEIKAKWRKKDVSIKN